MTDNYVNMYMYRIGLMGRKRNVLKKKKKNK